jgi:hypothetical protein
MMTSKTFKTKGITICFMFTLLIILSQSVLSQKDTTKNLIYNKNIDIFNQVINEYVFFIKKVYKGDNPFFVIIDHIYSSEEIHILSMSYTYTNVFSKLEENKDAIVYAYNTDSTIFVVVTNFFYGDSVLKTDIINKFKAKEITENILKKTFYPLTIESLINNNPEKFEEILYKESFYDNEKLDLDIYGDDIIMSEDGTYFRYFNNRISLFKNEKEPE